MVELLLKAGADPNHALPGGETPLMTASRTGKVEAVRALLAQGANVERKGSRGQTAIVWAAAEGNVEAARGVDQGRREFQDSPQFGIHAVI